VAGADVVQDCARGLADALGRVGNDIVLGVYLHGSAVLGDWSRNASDVDVLVIVRDDVSSVVAERLASILAADGDCPGVGLEVSIVEASAAVTPTAPWPFVVHVTTAPGDRKTVWGSPSVGDVDLILHYAVTRRFGWAAFGPDPETVIGEIAESVVLGQLADELRWSVDHASESYAIPNACRALRYRDERVLCSKTEGGEWALAHDIETALIRRALDDRRRGRSSPIAANATAWVRTVAADLDTA
jgi:hypothetical protein